MNRISDVRQSKCLCVFYSKITITICFLFEINLINSIIFFGLQIFSVENEFLIFRNKKVALYFLFLFEQKPTAIIIAIEKGYFL